MSRIFTRVGFSGLAIAVLALLLAVQTVRIEGLKVWPLSVEGWKARALAAERTVREVAAAQRRALEQAQAAKAKAENDYRELAERIDDEADQAHDGAMADAERFIAAGGLRCPSDRGAPSRPAAPAEDHRAGDGEAAGAAAELDATLVAVTADDVRICTANTLQAEAGRAWALELEAYPQQ